MIVAVLYALAMAILLGYGLNLIWLAFGFVRSADTPALRVDASPASDQTQLPAVTVQLPVYNEKYVIGRLLDACAELDYPPERLQIQVLDDSTDETSHLIEGHVRKWRSMGVQIDHVRRPDRIGFKAGALQYGLSQATGEFIAIFDADFVPDPDFLRRLLPMFDHDEIGMVQARWSHLNADDSALTRMQALGLDAHFVVEQRVRNATGCFINFNGTAGIWRASCIHDAGGWSGETLTEDLDLSYRAQLRGWRFKMAANVEVAAELPVDVNALRAQQYRWTKGAVQTAMRLSGRLLRSRFSFKTKAEGLLHLTNHLVYPAVLLAAVLHVPLLCLKSLGRGPGPAFFSVMALGMLALVGVFLVQMFTQRDLHSDWARRMIYFPTFMAGMMGLSVNNSRAVISALLGRRSGFVRTPKPDLASATGNDGWWNSSYALVELQPVVAVEITLALYSVVGLALAIWLGEWMAIPFQALFAAGFCLVVYFNVRQLVVARRALALGRSSVRLSGGAAV